MPDFQDPTDSEKTLALVAHVGGYFTSIIVPIVLMFTAKHEPDEPPTFSSVHAREALNYQITLMFHMGFIVLISFIIIGGGWLATGDLNPWVMLSSALFIVVMCVLYLIFETFVVVLACLSAKRGQPFRYPLTLRFI